MVRTIVTPQSTDLHISIPKKYIGKRVEVIFFDLDEADSKLEAETKFELDDAKIAILEQRLSAPRERYISEKESLKRLNEKI